MGFELHAKRTVILRGDSCDACPRVQRGAEDVRKCAYENFIAIAESQECRALAGICFCFWGTQRAPDDAARRFFGFVEGRESTAQTETLRIARVHAGNEGTHQVIEKLRRKFSADKGGDRFVSIRRNTFSDEIAKQSPLGGSIDQRASEKSRRTQRNGPKHAVHEDVARRAGGSQDDLIGNTEILEERPERGGAVKALRTEFEEEAVARDGLNDSAGTGRGFEEMRIQAGFAECVGADEAGNSSADHQCLDAGRHGVLPVIDSSESF